MVGMLFLSVEKRIEALKSQLNFSSDVASRILEVGSTKVGLVYLKSMIDETLFVKGDM